MGKNLLHTQRGQAISSYFYKIITHPNQAYTHTFCSRRAKKCYKQFASKIYYMYLALMEKEWFYLIGKLKTLKQIISPYYPRSTKVIFISDHPLVHCPFRYMYNISCFRLCAGTFRLSYSLLSVCLLESCPLSNWTDLITPAPPTLCTQLFQLAPSNYH